jgi:6-pyruvoyltetrahydropterin/6-carboxytetrahydropterin synthase
MPDTGYLTRIECRVTRIEMFTISAEKRFWASHRLALPDGSKEPEHHHNWSVIAVISSGSLNSMGLVMDFGQLKDLLGSIVAEFDNTALDSIDYFRKNSSSAENVAKYIYEKLQTKLPKAVKLRSVEVVEEPGCSAVFSRDKTAG